MQAVILAGGKGTRLRPVTVDLPKPLVPIANRPLIIHQLRHLTAAGIEDVTLALGYNADRFAGVEDEADRLGINLQLITEPEPLGTGGALRWCADKGAFDDRPLLWMNGDVVASPDVVSMHKFHTDRDAVLTFWLTSARKVDEFGVLELDDEGRVQQFLEKPAPDETRSHLVNAGILMLDPSLLDRIASGSFFSFEQGLLPTLVKEREPLYGIFDGGYWLDIGRPRFYLSANRHVMEGRVDWWPEGSLTTGGVWEGDDVKREGSTVIQPAVLGSGTVLEAGVELFGRTVLGDGCIVRSGAALEGCVLFDDVEVGHGAEVINSIVCAGARIGDDVVLRDAVIGARTVVGDRNELRGTRLWNDVELPDGVLVVDD
ncbi:MAG TPA: NDP-sugar synthase [Egibacteraceae bacterium]|nr:NDP-sugar synthase [Egibacteraceae bacterium]